MLARSRIVSKNASHNRCFVVIGSENNKVPHSPHEVSEQVERATGRYFGAGSVAFWLKSELKVDSKYC